MRTLILILSFNLFVVSENILAQQDSTWTLEECIEYALNRNIQVRKSELTNQRFRLYADQAKAQRIPSLNASLSQNFNWSKSTVTGESGLTGTSGSNYSVNSGVTIYNASRINNLIKQAELDIEGGTYSLETTKESISLSILNAFLQVLYAEEQVKNSRKQIESTAGQLNLALERLALQVISQADYAQVKSQMASEKLTLANSESQMAIAKVNLMQLMELPVTSDFNIVQPDLGESLNENRVPDVKTVYETALAIKPQVKSAAVNKEIAAIDEKIAQAAYFPALSASAGISSGFSSQTTDPYFDQLNNGIKPSAGFSLSIPIYQKKQVKTNVAVAKIGYQDAELSETNTKNQLRKSIEQACQDITSAQIEYEASLEKYSATQESTALSDEKFRQGIINSVDYIVSKTNLIIAESQLLQSKYNLIFSYKILDFYMGIPLSL
ncbi:MAG: TolC family protein [Bacteroidales bacterium]|nr:TolC family protein [Bacteroidales bacterium]MDP3003615.1 TolC family protein [Bacteroidales bacterium]